MSELTEHDIEAIRALAGEGLSAVELAGRYNVTDRHIRRIIAGAQRAELDVGAALGDRGGVRAALEAFLGRREMDPADEILAETARVLAYKIDACRGSKAATSAQALPRLAGALVAAIGELRGNERPPDGIDELIARVEAKRAALRESHAGRE